MWDRISEWCRREKTPQYTLSSSMGWARNRLSRMKHGEIEIKLENLEIIAARLGWSLGYLLDGDPARAPDPAGLTPHDWTVVVLARHLGHEKAIARLTEREAVTTPGGSGGEVRYHDDPDQTRARVAKRTRARKDQSG